MNQHVFFILLSLSTTFLITKVVEADEAKREPKTVKITFTPKYYGKSQFTYDRENTFEAGEDDYEDYSDEDRDDKADYLTVVQIFKNTLEKSDIYQDATKEERSKMFGKVDEIGAYLLSDNHTLEGQDDLTADDADDKEMLKLIKELRGHSTDFVRKILEYFLFSDSPNDSEDGVVEEILENTKKDIIEREKKMQSKQQKAVKDEL